MATEDMAKLDFRRSKAHLTLHDGKQLPQYGLSIPCQRMPNWNQKEYEGLPKPPGVADRIYQFLRVGGRHVDLSERSPYR